MASLLGLSSYCSGDESNDSVSEAVEFKSENIDPALSIKSSICIDSAPLVLYSKEEDEHAFIDEKLKILPYNPRYEEMWTSKAGPQNPMITEFHKATKNSLAGYVEKASVSDFNFDTQRKTFQSFGYAIDPSSSSVGDQIVGDATEATDKKTATIFEKTPLRPKDKRRRERNDDPSDIDGYLGPWANYKDQCMVARPTEEQQKEIDAILSKRKKRVRGGVVEEEESKSTLHINDPYDYLGRSFLHIPQDLGKNLRSTEQMTEKCYIPKKIVHTYTGHTKGIQKMELFPLSGHIFLTCSMDSKVKLWEFYGERRCIRTYGGHAQGVRDISFNSDGTEFLSASFDRFIKLWDVETGKVKAKFTNKKVPYCVVFNPDEDKKHLFVTGTSDKKILCYDTRSGEIVQEYDRHLGAVNTVTFVDSNKRLVSTSDDKSIRAWEWDIPVDFKYLADPQQHSMPAVSLSRNGRYLAFQSMDNQIKIMEPNANFRWKNKKVFRGHMVAGYACGIDFSPDMSYLISGDADGRLAIWDWKTTKLYDKIKAHSQVCMDVKWHPHETSKILTCGWDGVVHLWD